ncbi:hypothetical protein B484DRAFT_407692 [Ochromonadaceae sp. CCMP2298]|nr:hypothetical protein B484DRAFT_407692 [Ochromonadaceae sp. CCMP2298]
MMNDLAGITAEKRFKLSKTLNPKTILNYRKTLNLKVKNGETSTDARMAAVKDITNFITFAAMNHAMVETLRVNPALILNIDATQFEVGSSKGKGIQVVVTERNGVETGPLKAAPKKGDNSTGLAYFIKFFLLINAAGDMHIPVFVVADPFMEEGAVDRYEVPGLGAGTDAGAPGWLVFTKTRGCNRAFYDWLNMQYVCNFAQKLRTVWGLPVDAPAWFQLDGEAIQIAPFKEKSTVEHFANYCIICGKPPASTTEVTQPCDCGNCFKGSKTCLKGIKDADIALDHPMVDRLKAIVALHCTTTKKPGLPEPPEQEEEEEESCIVATKKRPKTAMTSAHRHATVFGLLRIQKAISKAISRSTITDSFKLAGIYPFSLHKILTNCKADISKIDYNAMEGAIHPLAKLIFKQGELKGSDIRKCIPDMDLPGLYDKDGLVLNRRRSVLLTSIVVLNSEVAKVEAKMEAAALVAPKKRKRAAKKTAAVVVPPPPASSSSSSEPPLSLRFNMRDKHCIDPNA